MLMLLEVIFNFCYPAPSAANIEAPVRWTEIAPGHEVFTISICAQLFQTKHSDMFWFYWTIYGGNNAHHSGIKTYCIVASRHTADALVTHSYMFNKGVNYDYRNCNQFIYPHACVCACSCTQVKPIQITDFIY